jgi:F-type H+-transporting ATPase subunit b
MDLLNFLAATAPGNPVTEIAQQFGVSWWKLISQCISFSLMCFVLYYYAYNPILAVLEERRKKIEEGLANAAEQKKQLAAAQVQVSDILSKASADAQKIIDDAKAAAKTYQERETTRATSEAEQIVSKAREAASREHTKMLAELKREVARLVISTTGKVTGKVLTDEDQKRLSEEAAKQIAA